MQIDIKLDVHDLENHLGEDAEDIIGNLARKGQLEKLMTIVGDDLAEYFLCQLHDDPYTVETAISNAFGSLDEPLPPKMKSNVFVVYNHDCDFSFSQAFQSPFASAVLIEKIRRIATAFIRNLEEGGEQFDDLCIEDVFRLCRNDKELKADLAENNIWVVSSEEEPDALLLFDEDQWIEAR